MRRPDDGPGECVFRPGDNGRLGPVLYGAHEDETPDTCRGLGSESAW